MKRLNSAEQAQAGVAMTLSKKGVPYSAAFLASVGRADEAVDLLAQEISASEGASYSDAVKMALHRHPALKNYYGPTALSERRI